jgi:hypothetical protein
MLIIAGWNHRSLVVDARDEPVLFKHEAAEVEAVRRFNCPDDADYVLAKGYRAVIEYDDEMARNKIAEVLQIPDNH